MSPADLTPSQNLWILVNLTALRSPLLLKTQFMINLLRDLCTLIRWCNNFATIQSIRSHSATLTRVVHDCRYTVITVMFILLCPPALGQDDLDAQLIAAVKAKKYGSVIRLLAKGANPNCRDESPAREDSQVSWRGYRWPAVLIPFDMRIPGFIVDREDVIEQLLANGADPNFMTPDGDTPLSIATFLDWRQTVRNLLRNGADPNFIWGTSSHIGPPAVFASAHMLKLLIAHGASVNVTNMDGHTPLFTQVMRGNIECAKLLLSLNADPNSADRLGTTPLAYVLSPSTRLGYYPQMMNLLLGYGASLIVRDKKGRSPLDFAKSNPKVDKETIARLEKIARRQIGLRELDSHLLQSVQAGDARAAATWIGKGADPNTRDDLGRPVSWLLPADANTKVWKFLDDAGTNWYPPAIRWRILTCSGRDCAAAIKDGEILQAFRESSADNGRKMRLVGLAGGLHSAFNPRRRRSVQWRSIGRSMCPKRTSSWMYSLLRCPRIFLLSWMDGSSAKSKELISPTSNCFCAPDGRTSCFFR